MTNHCPNPNQIRSILTVESAKRIDEFSEFLSEKIYEFLEGESFDGILGMPEEWDSCQNCERNVLNVQEEFLAKLERILLSKLQNTGIFNN